MYRPYGLQDRDTLLETLIMDDVMTFFPEFNLLVVSSSYDRAKGYIIGLLPSSMPEPLKSQAESSLRDATLCPDMVFEGGQNKAFAIFDTFERDADGGYSYDPRLLMLANLFSWSPTIDVDSIPDMVDAAANYQEYQLSNREFRDYVRRDVLAKSKSEPSLLPDSEELLEKITSGETVSYFPEFNLLITTVDYDPYERYDRMSAAFNVFPSELAYGELFHGFENVVDIPYSGPVIDPIDFCGTFSSDKANRGSPMSALPDWPNFSQGTMSSARSPCRSFLTLWPTASVSSPRSGRVSPSGRRRKSHARTQGPDIEVEIDSYNEDDFITGTVTVDGKSCHFNCPNNNRNPNGCDSVILEPLRPRGVRGRYRG